MAAEEGQRTKKSHVGDARPNAARSWPADGAGAGTAFLQMKIEEAAMDEHERTVRAASASGSKDRLLHPLPGLPGGVRGACCRELADNARDMVAAVAVSRLGYWRVG